MIVYLFFWFGGFVELNVFVVVLFFVEFDFKNGFNGNVC